MPSHRRIIIVVATMLLLAVASGSLAGASTNQTHTSSSGRVQVSAKTPDGHLRCTATFPKELQPGHNTDAQMFVQNLTKRTIHVDGVSPGELAISKNGVQLAATTAPGVVPTPPSLDLPAHHTARLEVYNTPVIWGGTLTVKALCDLPVDLPTVHLWVADPGATPSIGTALADSTARMHGVFDDCMPVANTSGVNGTFPPPDGSGLTPLGMRCWADVQQKAGFGVVDLYLVTPHDAPRLEPALHVFPNGPAHGQYMEVGHWQFVVTASSTIATGGVVITQTPTHRGGHSIMFNHGPHGWSRHKEGCGGESFLIGGTKGRQPIQLVWMGGCF